MRYLWGGLVLVVLALAFAPIAARAQPVDLLEGVESYQLPTEIGPPPVDNSKDRRQRDNQNKIVPALVATQVVHVLDIVTTIQCGKSDHCEEVNAVWLYGRKPKVWRTVAVKVPIMILTHVVAREVAKDHPVAAHLFLGSQLIITGKMVVGNINILW